jgi:heme oxygenase
MSLKEITKDLHTSAERTVFAKKLLSGSISKADYANYLFQLIAVYTIIENSCREQGILNCLPGIERAEAIGLDFLEIADPAHEYKVLPSTFNYINYLKRLDGDYENRPLMKAHMYCRHMGDLFGGQIIKRRVAHASSGKFYEFENPEALKALIRSELTDNLGDEARVAFQFAIDMMRELNNE